MTIYSWTHPKNGLVWCLASANGFDVSHLKWGGDETYAEVLFELLAKSPTFLAATGLRLRRGLLCDDDVRLDFQTLDRVWCTKRVKSTDTDRPVFQKYGSTRKSTGRRVNLRVDPYFRYGTTRIFAGRPVNIRVHPQVYGWTRITRVDPYFTGLLACLGRPVIMSKIRVDP